MADDPPRRARRFLDPDFRWRATDVTRMEAMGDAVFALVLALLFLQEASPANFHDVKGALMNFLPFAITFTLMAMVWVEHFRFFRRYALADKSTFFGNLFLLFLVLFYAYPLKFLFTFLCVEIFGSIGGLSFQSMMVGAEELRPATLMLIYSGGFGAIYLTFALLYAHAMRRAGDLDLDVVERHMTATRIIESLVLVGFALMSMALATFDLTAPAGLVYFGIGPTMGFVGARRGSQQRRLLATRAAA